MPHMAQGGPASPPSKVFGWAASVNDPDSLAAFKYGLSTQQLARPIPSLQASLQRAPTTLELSARLDQLSGELRSAMRSLSALGSLSSLAALAELDEACLVTHAQQLQVQVAEMEARLEQQRRSASTSAASVVGPLAKFEGVSGQPPILPFSGASAQDLVAAMVATRSATLARLQAQEGRERQEASSHVDRAAATSEAAVAAVAAARARGQAASGPPLRPDEPGSTSFGAPWGPSSGVPGLRATSSSEGAGRLPLRQHSVPDDESGPVLAERRGGPSNTLLSAGSSSLHVTTSGLPAATEGSLPSPIAAAISASVGQVLAEDDEMPSLRAGYGIAPGAVPPASATTAAVAAAGSVQAAPVLAVVEPWPVSYPPATRSIPDSALFGVPGRPSSFLNAAPGLEQHLPPGDGGGLPPATTLKQWMATNSNEALFCPPGPPASFEPPPSAAAAAAAAAEQLNRGRQQQLEEVERQLVRLHERLSEVDPEADAAAPPPPPLPQQAASLADVTPTASSPTIAAEFLASDALHGAPRASSAAGGGGGGSTTRGNDLGATIRSNVRQPVSATPPPSRLGALGKLGSTGEAGGADGAREVDHLAALLPAPPGPE